MPKKIKKLTILLLYLSLTAFAVFAVLSINGATVSFNDAVYNAISRIISPILTSAMIFISNMGEWFVYVPVLLLLIIIPRSRIKVGIPAGIVLAASAALNTLLKLAFHIDRPDIHRLTTVAGYSFPSGHAMNATAFVSVCCWLFFRYSNKKPRKIAALSASIVFLVMMGCSRIYLGVHYASDVLAGYAMGLALVMVAILVCEKVYPRR